MAEEKDLAHILKLLDDESPKVRERVWRELESHLPAWEAGIRARLGELPDTARRRILDLLSGRARSGFRSAWMRWRGIPGEMERLEAALSGLSWYLASARTPADPAGGNTGVTRPASDAAARERVQLRTAAALSAAPRGDEPPRHPSLSPLLDSLAREFRAEGRPMRPSALARFLFADKGLQGAEGDYYDPGNSDLVQVIEKKQGIPISLACVFMLVGHRLGMDIYGCDVPEHFLTRGLEAGREIIIDCFDGGKVLDAERLGQLERKYAPEFTRLLRSAADPEAIIARVLRNLINAYHLAGDRPASQFMWSLAEDLRGERVADPGDAEGRGGPGEDRE